MNEDSSKTIIFFDKVMSNSRNWIYCRRFLWSIFCIASNEEWSAVNIIDCRLIQFFFKHHEIRARFSQWGHFLLVPVKLAISQHRLTSSGYKKSKKLKFITRTSSAFWLLIKIFFMKKIAFISINPDWKTYRRSVKDKSATLIFYGNRFYYDKLPGMHQVSKIRGGR